MDAVCALETTAQQSTAEHPQTTGQTLWKPEFALGENGPICAKCSLAGADTHSRTVPFSFCCTQEEIECRICAGKCWESQEQFPLIPFCDTIWI